MKSIVQFINEALKDGKHQKITFFEFLTMFAEEIGEDFKVDSEESMEEFFKFIADNKKYGFEMEYEEEVEMYGESGWHYDATSDRDFKNGDDMILDLVENLLDAKSADIAIVDKKGRNGVLKTYSYCYDDLEFVLYVYK